MDFLIYKSRQADPKIYMKTQRTEISQNDLRKNNITLPDFKTYKIIVIGILRHLIKE